MLSHLFEEQVVVIGARVKPGVCWCNNTLSVEVLIYPFWVLAFDYFLLPPPPLSLLLSPSSLNRLAK